MDAQHFANGPGRVTQQTPPFQAAGVIAATFSFSFVSPRGRLLTACDQMRIIFRAPTHHAGSAAIAALRPASRLFEKNKSLKDGLA